MSNFTDALASAARSGVCQLLGLPQYLNDMTTRLSGGVFTPPLNQIPNLWRRALCDRDAPEPEPPPFTGGQCPVFYFITTRLAFTQISTGDEFDSTAEFASAVLGPISQTRRRVGNNEVLFAVSPDGTETALRSSNAITNDITTLTIVSVRTANGTPDNCGNPDPEYPPLTPPDVTIPRDIEYEDADGVTVVVPVTFEFARTQIDVEANVIIPFTLNFSPELNITGTVNIDGEVNFNFGGGSATTLPKDPRKGDCEDIGLPDGEVPDDPTGSDQPAQPNRELEQVIRGVLVTVSSLTNERASTIVQDDNPDIYVPSLGHVQFLCRVGLASGAWTTDIPVKNRRNLIECPWSLGAIDVRGTPQPGVTWQLTPVFGYNDVPVEVVQ